jgi:hypothetical protein
MPWKSPSRPRSSLVAPVATAGFDGRVPAKSSRSLAALNSHHKRTMTGLPHRQHTWAAMAP